MTIAVGGHSGRQEPLYYTRDDGCIAARKFLKGSAKCLECPFPKCVLTNRPERSILQIKTGELQKILPAQT